MDILEKAESLLRYGWISGHEAVDENWHDVEPWSEKACKWCVLGAVKASCYYTDNYEYEVKYYMSVITIANPIVMNKDGYGSNYVEFHNDKTSQERAIEMVQKAQAFLARHPRTPKMVVKGAK